MVFITDLYSLHRKYKALLVLEVCSIYQTRAKEQQSLRFKFAEIKSHLRLRKCKKISQRYLELADLWLQTIHCYFAELAVSRVAKISQKRGGGFFEVWINHIRTWPEFSLVLNWIKETSERFSVQNPVISKKGLHRNSERFSLQDQVISKKKGLHRNSERLSLQNQVITKKKKNGLHRNSERFSLQNQVISKKKKRKEIQTIFLSKITIVSRSLGGLFSFLELKLTSKLLKTCYFAYFSGQWEGGYSTICPPPSYVTVWGCGIEY